MWVLSSTFPTFEWTWVRKITVLQVGPFMPETLRKVGQKVRTVIMLILNITIFLLLSIYQRGFVTIISCPAKKSIFGSFYQLLIVIRYNRSKVITLIGTNCNLMTTQSKLINVIILIQSQNWLPNYNNNQIYYLLEVNMGQFDSIYKKLYQWPH